MIIIKLGFKNAENVSLRTANFSLHTFHTLRSVTDKLMDVGADHTHTHVSHLWLVSH